MDGETTAVAATNWQGVILSAAIPLIVAAACVYAALQPSWDDSGDWAYALFALLPLEFVRALVLTILGDTFLNYQSPGQAVRYWLLSLAILAGLLLIGAVWLLGFRDFFAAIIDPHTWAVILPVAALIVADGFISVYFFRGDARVQGARLQAAADDASDLFGLALWPTPVFFLLGAILLMALKQSGSIDAAAVPELGAVTGEMIRSAALLYGAVYFLAKAVVMGHVHTAAFNRSGRRLLGGAWLGRVQMRKAEERVADQSKEAKRVAERQQALRAINSRY